MRCVIALMVSFLSVSTASAQSSAGVFAGYVYAHPDFENIHVSAGDSLNGWLGGVDVPIVDHLGIVARADGAYGLAFRQGLVISTRGDIVRSSLYTVTAGPRVTVSGRSMTMFADALVGVAHGTARSMGVDFLGVVEDTKFVGESALEWACD
jgi:hypothetical protein